MSPDSQLINELRTRLEADALPVGPGKFPARAAGTYQIVRRYQLERSLENERGKFVISLMLVDETHEDAGSRKLALFADQPLVYMLVEEFATEAGTETVGETWQNEMSASIERVLAVRFAVHQWFQRKAADFCFVPNALTTIGNVTISEVRAILTECDTVAIYDEPMLAYGLVRSVMAYRYKLEYGV